MARIQVLELPVERSGAAVAAPFVLVFDQVGDMSPELLDQVEGIKDAVGARAVLVFAESVELG